MKLFPFKISQPSAFLVIILFLSALVRIWGIDFGLPHTGIKHDELYSIQIVLRMGSGDLNPHLFNYPSLYLYILFTLYSLYYTLGTIFGRWESSFAFLKEFALTPDNFFLISRLLSAFSGVATVWVVYRFSATLFNKRIALLSAVFTSIAYVHVRESHFGKNDTAATLLILLAMWFILKLMRTGTWQHYIQAGLVSGLATSTKYNGVFLIVPLLLAHFFRTFKKPKNLAQVLDRKLVLVSLAFGLGFFAGTPFAVLDFPTFYQDIISLAETSKRPWYGVMQGLGWVYHLNVSLFYGVGATMLVAGIIGMVLLFKKDFQKGIFLSVFPIIYYLVIGNSYIVFSRYALPIVPFLCIYAAFLVDEVGKFLTQVTTHRLRKIVTYLLLLIIIGPSTLFSIQFINLLTKKDNRLIAADWMYKNVKGGSSIYQVGSWLGTMQLSPSISSLKSEYQTMQPTSQEQILKRAMTAEKIAYLKLVNRDGFDEWTYDQKMAAFIFAAEAQRGFPDYIVLYESPLLIDKTTSPMDERVITIITQLYQLIQTFKALDISANNGIYEHQDAFYLPFAHFSGLERPGPNIFIYQYKQL